MPVPAKIQPAVDADRLNKTLQYSCQWGSTPDGGMGE